VSTTEKLPDFFENRVTEVINKIKCYGASAPTAQDIAWSLFVFLPAILCTWRWCKKTAS